MADQNISNVMDDLDTSEADHTQESSLIGDPPSSRNSLQKILCCNKIQHHKSPISNTLENQEALDWFKHACGGNLPNDSHDPSKKVYWWAYKELFCVVSHGSRGSKKLKGVNFYGLSITTPGGKEAQRVTVIPESVAQAEKIDVVGARQAKNTVGRDVCLVREEGGMELSCKRHLDTIYTVYRVHYQGIRGAQRSRNGEDEDWLAESRREYMQSRAELMARFEPKLFEKVTIPEELYGSTRQEHIDAVGTVPPMFMFPSDDIYRPAKLMVPDPESITIQSPGFSGSTAVESLVSEAAEKVPLDMEQSAPAHPPSGLRTPAHTPGTKSTECNEKVPLDVDRSALVLPLATTPMTPIRTPTSTVPPPLSESPAASITPSKRKAPSNHTAWGPPGRGRKVQQVHPPGVKMVSCSRHSWLVPENELGMNHKTGEPFKTCKRCREKNRKMAARLRGEVSDDE